MARSGAFAKKRKKTVKKNPMESALLHLSGTKYGQVKQEGHIYTAYVLQKVNTGIGEEMDLLDSKSFKTKSGAANWLAKNYGRMKNPRKKTVSQKISQLEHEGYPHKQSIAIALSEQRRGKVKRNPMSAYTVFHRGTSNIAGQVMASGAETAKRMVAQKLGIPSITYLVAKKETNKQGFYAKNPSNEIPAYEITRNFKVLGIFQTKSDAIKAAQGISDATGKTIAVKPVQVLAGHFDR
jgi:DNA gyrase/topoisomerase IV subunit A